MGFLDNLESSLETFESGNEREDAGREKDRRSSERAKAAAIGPWAERLKASPFTAALMSVATREGHKRRTKVYIMWMGPTLRLDARERRLELRPTANGVLAVFAANGEESGSRAIDLEGDPAELVIEWLTPGAV